MHGSKTAQVNKTQFIFTIPLISPNKNYNYQWMLRISFSLTSEMTFGYLMLITIKYGRHNNRCVKTHESDSEVTVRRLGKIIQRIYFAQSGASIRTKAWKWSGETRFPGALLLL